MSKRKITCENTNCLHHRNGNQCDKFIKLDDDGVCTTFKKGIIYYLRKVRKAMGKSNYIDAVALTPDLRIGMFYLMTLYHVNYSVMDWGNCRMYMFRASESSDILKFSDIIKREFDEEKYVFYLKQLNNGILPHEQSEQKENIEMSDPIKIRDDIYKCEYGWLSPTAVWTPADFGEHERVAQEIVEKHNWTDEFDAFKAASPGSGCLMRDFLVEQKHYVLLHNTQIYGSAKALYNKLTKTQEKWLYDYYLMYDPIKAAQY